MSNPSKLGNLSKAEQGIKDSQQGPAEKKPANETAPEAEEKKEEKDGNK